MSSRRRIARRIAPKPGTCTEYSSDEYPLKTALLHSHPMDSVRDQLQQALGETYRVDRELGGGGMSRVFRSTETALDRRVVLKILPPDLASGVSVDRFKREIDAADAAA